MVTVRSAKNKGAQFEYSVRDSLAQKYPDALLTKQEGFKAQYDIIIHSEHIVIECKHHKGFSWNELKKYYDKLKSRTPNICTPLVVFKANNQPVLVMKTTASGLTVSTFEDYFGVPFIKHKGAKKDEPKPMEL